MELSPLAAAQEWKKGSFRPAYLFYGEDDTAKPAALDALVAAFKADPLNVSDFPGDSDSAAAEAVNTLNTAPMFADKRLVVIKNARYGINARKELAQYLKQPLPGTVLVLTSDERKLDAKDPLAAAVSALGGVVAFKAMKEAEAVVRLKEEARKAGFELAGEAADRMVEEAGTEWGILKAELEKLKLFVKGKKAAGLEDALACLGYRKESNPFDFPRAIQTRQAKTCMSLLRRQLEEDAEPFGLLRGITNTLNKQLKAKRLVKAGVAAEQIFRELRLQSYYDRDFLTQLARISEDRLIRDLGECVAAEVALKSKSWLDPAAELSLLVGRICTPTARK